jgi:hypothetical protein
MFNISVDSESGFNVTNKSTNWYTHGKEYPNNSEYKPGDLRFNTYTQKFELYIGDQWQIPNIGCHIHVPEKLKESLDWVQGKIQEERTLELLAEKYAIVRDLVDKKKNLEDQITMLTLLMKDR